MKIRNPEALALFFVLVTAMTMPKATAQSSMKTAPPAPPNAAESNAHVVSTFRFEVAAPMARVAPLFAPEAERSWAGEHWNPAFAYPQPGADVQGAVWKIKHGPVDSVWVNTLFDVPGGRMQYVAVVGNHFAMTVDVLVTALAEQRTAVEVTYARTALDPSANQHVVELGDRDRESGPEWQRSLETALGLPHK
jgi:hypothetical protein